MNLEGLLKRDETLTRDEAERLVGRLLEQWNVQTPMMKASLRTRPDLTGLDDLDDDLTRLHHWFNPTASGKRLRESLEALPAAEEFELALVGDLLEPVDQRRALVTPEGRICMWLLASALDDYPGSPDDTVWPSSEHLTVAWSKLASLYRAWNRQRISNVIGLLREETATLRPSVAGLLLVLLINRNTSFERRVPGSREAQVSADVSATLSVPAIAFANKLTGSPKAGARGIDLYRGWAVGEIARRLGAGLHRTSEGIWIDEGAVQIAEARLVESLISRPANQLDDVTDALDAALSSYESVRPRLTSLGIAHERPSVTSRLVEKIRSSILEAQRVSS